MTIEVKCTGIYYFVFKIITLVDMFHHDTF
jgi:hypothetical protein